MTGPGPQVCCDWQSEWLYGQGRLAAAEGRGSAGRVTCPSAASCPWREKKWKEAVWSLACEGWSSCPGGGPCRPRGPSGGPRAAEVWMPRRFRLLDAALAEIWEESAKAVKDRRRRNSIRWRLKMNV